MTSRRSLAVASVCAALLAGCGAVDTQTDALDRLKPCTSEQGPLDAYCGSVEVWEDREAETGRRISLKVVVLAGARRNEHPDPLFFLAGGPGLGAAQVSSEIQRSFRPLLADRDMVFVDQRGAGESNSLACDLDDDDSLAADPQRFYRLLRECMEGFDADLRLYTTPIAMDDLNEVREFLGYERVNLYGGSYGTRAAIAYLRRYPETVRSVVLDGVAPPDLILPQYFARDSQRAWDLLIADCNADPACADAFPNLAARFEQLLSRLDADPERVTLTHPRTGKREVVTVDRRLVSLIVFDALYTSETAATLPFLIDRATEGDYSGLLALSSVGVSAGVEISLGMRYSVICAEDAPRATPAALVREAAGTFGRAALAEMFLEPCKFWPRGEVPGDYYEPFVAETPALLLSGRLDPVTPPQWAEQIVEQWPNARHIVAPGIGHGAATHGCLMRLIREFLNEPNPEGLDASCVETLRRRPFFLGYAGPVQPSPAAHPRGGASRGERP
ncbi:MAG: alpha/beta fold hydrolase [Acidobacteria bacterium]|nr:alpha/beta fold hydrolase [Acidobacteriota bacterium]